MDFAAELTSVTQLGHPSSAPTDPMESTCAMIRRLEDEARIALATHFPKNTPR